MGIRAKLFWLYLLTFALMASIASVLLLSFMQTKFLRLEADQAEQMMVRLLRNFEAELTHLNDLNTDWSNWDGMYLFAKNGSPGFIQDELGPGALQSAKINLMAVFDSRGKIVASQAVDLASRRELPIDAFAPVLLAVQAALEQDRQSKVCGAYNLDSSSLLLCWQPIRRTDQRGDYVGTILMARVLDSLILERMRKQSAIDFVIRPIEGNAPIQPDQSRGALQGPQVNLLRIGKDVVSAELSGLSGKPALDVQMHFPDDVSRNGNQVIQWVMSVMLLVVALNGGGLIIGVHLLLVNRIKSVSSELKAISASASWDSRITSASGTDELNTLGEDVNQLLEVIAEQVMSLEALTLTDSLTLVANRRAFDLRLAIEMEARMRSGLPLAMLALDVDYLKLYNDNYGHPAGDNALRVLGKILRETARPGDLPARVGGEEFAVLLPNTDLEGAEALARRLSHSLKEHNIPHAYSQAASYLTVSIGITIAGDEPLDSFVARADHAVYQSKTNGRNQLTTLLPGFV